MSGMLTKEFLYLKVQKRALYSALIIAVLLFVTMMSQSHGSPSDRAAAFAALIGIMMAMLTVTETFNGVASDEKAKWDAYARSLPVSTAQIIGAKYLFVLILSAVGIVFGVLIELAVTGGRAGGDVLLILCAVTSGVSILMCSIELPIYYQFGLQKSNLIVLLVFCLGPVLISHFAGKAAAGPTDAQVYTILRLVPVIALAVMAVSFFISCAVYKRKAV